MAKIMLVEDDNNLREIYGARLGAEGHTIVSARDGEEALAMAVKEKPDLIISDVMMPRVSGFDMLDILRNAPETKNTKIIMMTALSQAEDKARADKLGADLYLVKSQVTLEDVAKAVDKILAGEPANANSNAPSNDSTPAEPQETPAVAPAPAPQPVVPAETPAEPSAAPISSPEPQESTPPEQSEPAPASPEPPQPAPIEQPPEPVPEPATQPAKDTAEAGIPPKSETEIAPAANVAPAPKKIEITETPSDPPAETEQAVAPPPEQNTEQPIKVELPNTQDEKTSEPKETPAETTEKPADSEPQADVGPNLDEILEKESQAEPEEADKPKPAAEAGSKPEEKNEPIEEEKTGTDVPEKAENPLDNSTKKKVIKPINDPAKKPDLEALLAKEEAAEAAINPPAGTAIEAPGVDSPAPASSADQKQEQSTQGRSPQRNDDEPKPPTDDFSKVAL